MEPFIRKSRPLCGKHRHFSAETPLSLLNVKSCGEGGGTSGLWEGVLPCQFSSAVVSRGLSILPVNLSRNLNEQRGAGRRCRFEVSQTPRPDVSAPLSICCRPRHVEHPWSRVLVNSGARLLGQGTLSAPAAGRLQWNGGLVLTHAFPHSF